MKDVRANHDSPLCGLLCVRCRGWGQSSDFSIRCDGSLAYDVPAFSTLELEPVSLQALGRLT
jgi:hypothetical protein